MDNCRDLLYSNTQTLSAVTSKLTRISGFEFVLFTAIGLLPTYALEQGFGQQTSYNVIAVMNALSLTCCLAKLLMLIEY